jgi:hypothetical protein
MWKPDHRKIDKKFRRGNLVKFESQDLMGSKYDGESSKGKNNYFM